MSTSIDNRVVGLQFDNKNFEKNTAKTLSSLDKLHAKLSMKGASKGLDELEKASSRCDLSNVSKAADTIQHRFSAMGIVGMNVLNRIADTAVNTASRMLKAFTIAPITQGYQEYELKMGSVQTIMASTGESIGTVNGYLEELNRYSDRTIYSFSDMTQNIGKFTNAGIKLEDAVKAIQGISNEAALSGANANEASRAMYNFSQALSSGAVKLIDWKSIENANMATKEFKQELLNTAAAMGTVTLTQDGMYKSGKTVFNATKNFNDSLQTQWMTSEVLIETLGRYSDETTDLGKRAFAAAQDIKTYSQLVDTVKESIGSGWAQISELIFGDLEEAKEMWTSIGKAMGDAVSGFFDPITDFLSHNLDSNYKKFLKDGPISSADKWVSDYQSVVDARNKPLQDELNQNNKRIVSYEQALEAQLKYNDRLKEMEQNGGWYKDDNGKKQWNLPKPKEIEETAESIAELKARNEELNKTLDDTTFLGSDIGMAYKKHFRDVQTELYRYQQAGYSYEEALKKVGLSEEKYLEMENFYRDIMSGKVSVEEMAKAFNELSNRKKIVLGLGNAFKFMGSVLKPIKDAFNATFFGGIDANWLGNLANKFYEFTANLKADSEVLDIVRQTFVGIFDGFHAVGRMIGNVFDAITSKLPPMGMIFKGLGAAFLMLGDELSTIGSDLAVWVDSGEFMADVMEGWTYIAGEFNSALSEIDKELRAIPQLEPVIDFFDRFGAAMDAAIASGDYRQVAKVFRDAFVEIGNNIGNLWNLIKTLDISEVWADIQGSVSSSIDKLTSKFDSLKARLQAIADYIKNKFNIDMQSIVSTGFLAILGLGLVKMVKSVASIAKMSKNVAKAMIKVTDAFRGVFKSISKFINAKAWTERAKGFKVAAFGLVELSVAVGILAGSMWIISKIPSDKLWNSAKTIGLMIATLAGIAVLASKFGGKEGAFGIAAVAAAIVSIAIAVKTLESIDYGSFNISSILYLVEALGALYVIADLASRLSKATKDGDVVKSALSIVALAAAMISVAVMMKVIASMDMSSIQNGIKNLGMAFAAVAALLVLARLGGRHAGAGGLGILAISAALYLLIPMLLLIANLPKNVVTKAMATLIVISKIFTILIASTRKAGKEAHKAAAVILAMALALLPLTAAILVLGHMDLLSCVQGVAALAVIVKSFTWILESMKGIKKIPLKTIVGLIVMVVAIGSVVAALSLIKDTKAVIASAGSLALVMAALSLMMFTIGKVPMDWSAIGKMAVMLAVVVGLGLIIAALSSVKNPEAALTMTIAIGALLAEITLVLLAMTVVGAAAPVALAGLGVLGATIAGFAAVLAIFAGLDQYFDAATHIANGIPVLEAIGEGIGRFVGAFVGGITAGAINSMTGIGTALSTFMMNLMPFIMGIQMIPDDIGTKVGAIAGAIATMIGADFMTGIKDFLGIDGMDSFATNIEKYGNGLTAFAKSIDGLDDSTLNKTETAARAGKMLAEMANTIPNDGGLWGWIVGNNDLGDFSKNLEDFGTAIKKLSEVTEGIKISNIENLAKAGTKLADMATDIPNEGGVLGAIMGDNKPADFATGLEGFGTAMAVLSESGADIDLDNIDKIATAGTKLATMADAIPNEGGKWAEFWGDNSTGGFASQMEVFGYTVWQLSKFGENVETSGMDDIYNATQKLVDVALLIEGIKLTGSQATNFQNVMTDYVGWMNSLVPSDSVGETGGLTSMLDSLVAILSGKSGEFQSAGTEMMKSFVNGMLSYRGHVMSKASSLAYSAVSKLRKYNEAKTAGDNIAQGFIDGMESRYSDVYKEGVRIGEAAVQGINDGGQMASPSRATRKSGRWIGAGFILGMQDMVRDISHTGVQLGESSVDAINDAIHRVSSVLSSDVNLQPVIRPVMDLSEIQNGTSEIAAMYNRKQVAIVAYGKHKADTYRMPVEAGSTNTPGESVFNFTQNNYSPKSLRSIDIYRKTKNQLSVAEGVLARRVK